jgi:DNA polymerase III sliding clamp (beta) subunit (PCNA family)
MQEIFLIVKNNDYEALDQVNDDLSFLIDQTKLTKAFEEVSKTADKVAHFS